MPPALGRGLLPVELKQIDADLSHYPRDKPVIRIHEQAHAGDKRRQAARDLRRPFYVDPPRAGLEEHEADGVGTRFDGRQGIVFAGYPANLNPSSHCDAL